MMQRGFLVLSKQLAVAAKAHQFYDIPFLIKPHQQEVPLHMALHTTFIVTVKHVRLVLRGNGLLIL